MLATPHAGAFRPASAPALAALLLAASLSATPARAQTPSPADPPPTRAQLQPGELLRVTTASLGRPVRTRLHAVRGDSLLLLSGTAGSGLQVLLPPSEIRRVEVRRRPAGLLGRNVAAGATVGLLAGGAGFLLWCGENRDECRETDREPDHYVPPEDRPTSAVVASLVGGGFIGAAIGYVATPRRWVPVDLSVTPAGGTGVQVGATLPGR